MHSLSSHYEGVGAAVVARVQADIGVVLQSLSNLHLAAFGVLHPEFQMDI